MVGIYSPKHVLVEIDTTHRAGTVEARIRQLVIKLEYVDALVLAHPFIRGFDQIHHCLTEEEIHNAAQDEISEAVSRRAKTDIEGKEGAATLYTTTFYIGLAIEKKSREGSVLAFHSYSVQADIM